MRLLQAASEQGLCVDPSVDRDPLFNKIRDSTEFKAVRQAVITSRCHPRIGSRLSGKRVSGLENADYTATYESPVLSLPKRTTN